MAYTSLYKLKYSAPREYDLTYQSRFQDSDTVHLNIDINGYPAFICQSAELFNLVIQIHKVDKSIRLLRAELPYVAIRQFTLRCLTDEIVLTNDIEGVNSTRREIHETLDELDKNKPHGRFNGLVRKYVMIGKSDGIQLETCQDVRSIYDELVLDEVVAENPNDAPDGEIFRKESVAVTNSAQKEIHHGIVPESAIKDAVQTVLDFVNDDAVDLLVRVAATHYLVGYIHPFYNGNGRLSRFISSALLTQELDPLIAYRLSYTIKENLKDYDDAFKICNDPRNRGDVTPFVFWFLIIVLEAMNKLDSALLERSKDLKHFEDLILNNPLYNTKRLSDISYLLVQASLFSELGISTSDLMKYGSVSRSALSKRLKQLDEYGVLITKTRGHSKYYKFDLSKLET